MTNHALASATDRRDRFAVKRKVLWTWSDCFPLFANSLHGYRFRLRQNFSPDCDFSLDPCRNKSCASPNNIDLCLTTVKRGALSYRSSS
jgi:hypothetical protein